MKKRLSGDGEPLFLFSFVIRFVIRLLADYKGLIAAPLEVSGMDKHLFELVPISRLNPAAYNPRTISDEALRGLAKSLDRWGLVEPIVWNKRTGNVVGGHQRLKVLTQRGNSEVACMVVDLPSAEEKALNVALNNPALQGKFSADVADLIAEFQAELTDLSPDLKFDDLLTEFTIPADAVGEEFDESCADDVEMIDCPHCGKSFPK